MNRDQSIQNHRPPIPGITHGKAVKPLEAFQNSTLRPILKFQNDLLIQLFKDYALGKKNGFYQQSSPKQLDFIAHSLQKDQRFRSLMLGSIIGLLTSEEMQFYISNKQELHKRMISMLIQRFQSQLELLNS